MPHSPSEFWETLIQQLGKMRKNESWLARKLEVPAQTLSSWKQRNQFRRACLAPLADLLQWEGLNENVATQLGVELIEGRVSAKTEIHPTEEALRRVNREYQVAEKTFKRYAGHTLRVLHTLGEHCFLAFSACTNSPYEFENTPDGHAIALVVAKALCNGALILYIRPTEDGVSYYRDTWGYGQLVYQDDAVREMAAFREQLRGWMVRGEVEGQRKLSGTEADRILYDRLGHCFVARSPMWLPGVSLNMIGWTHVRELKTRMTIGLPGARFGGMLVYPRYSTLEFRFGRFLRAVVLEACKEVHAMKEGRSCGQVQVVLPEKVPPDKALASVERFFERYSQLLRSVYSIEPGEGALS
ncbi:hypothetical protein ACYOEI_14715 [Singulisphaera rosea]